MIGDFIISLGGNNQSMEDKTVNGRCSAVLRLALVLPTPVGLSLTDTYIRHKEYVIFKSAKNMENGYFNVFMCHDFTIQMLSAACLLS